MRPAGRVLRSERGDLLLDSMAGAVIVIVVFLAAVAVVTAATIASATTSHASSRSILLNTTLNDQLPRLASFTGAPTAVTGALDGQSVTMTLWREDADGGKLAILHGAVARSSDPSAPPCTDPATITADSCITAQSSAVTVKGPIATTSVPLVAGTAPTLFTLTVPSGQAELRYVFKVSSASADSTLSFANTDHPGVSTDVKIPAGQTGYYYGRLRVDAGSHLSITTTGPAAVDPASFLIYEAPQ